MSAALTGCSESAEAATAASATILKLLILRSFHSGEPAAASDAGFPDRQDRSEW
jgi:hypothetical protein